jgi:hypothetical protein
MANPVVEHQPPEPQSGALRVTWRTGAAWGAAFTVPAVIASVISGGVGHGNFIAWKVLYPFTALLGNIFESTMGIWMLLGLFQFPLYGALAAMRTRVSLGFLAVLLVLHVIAVWACFAPLLDFILY